MVLRPADDAVYLAQGAAGPLNGDDLQLEVIVPDGCHLRLRAVASTLALPSVIGGTARISLTATVGAGASLEVLLEPVVVATGAVVELVTSIDLAEDSRLLWREEVVLGRHGETGGSAGSRIDVVRDGKPLLRSGFQLRGDDPVSRGPAGTGGGRAVGSLLLVGDEQPPRPPTRDCAVLLLAGGGTLLTAVAGSAIELRRALEPSTTLARAW